jgi:hypothetical protein
MGKHNRRRRIAIGAGIAGLTMAGALGHAGVSGADESPTTTQPAPAATLPPTTTAPAPAPTLPPATTSPNSTVPPTTAPGAAIPVVEAPHLGG